MKTLIVVVGATGSGKTDLSIELAKQHNCPIISTDSRQFFKGMAIGTAQPEPEQLQAVKHYFIADREVSDTLNCGKYEREAIELLDKLFLEHDYVVAVGGSGLYINALCDGLDDFDDVDPQIRARLKTLTLEQLQEKLQCLDPKYYAQVDTQNPRRLIRAIEICEQTGKPYSELREGKKSVRNFAVKKIGIKMNREKLYERINLRVDKMIEAGLEAEARVMLPFRELNSLQTVGYREMFDYFDGKITRDEAIELIKRNSRRYAKRQMTWFNRDLDIEWIEVKSYC